MELKKFIDTIISNIDSAANQVNNKSSQDESLSKSNVSFDIFVDINKDKIFVLDLKTI